MNKIYKITGYYWYAVIKSILYFYAKDEKEAIKKCSDLTGYESFDIKTVEETTVEEVLANYVYDYKKE